MFDRHYAVWPAHLPRHLAVPQTSLFDNLRISAQRYPQHTALLYYDTPISYARWLAESEALAGYLQQAGVQRGDRVLLYLQNSPQFAIGYYAILRADAVVVPVNPMNRRAELEHLQRDTGARLCLCGRELLDEVTPLLAAQDGLQEVIVSAYGEYLERPTDLELPQELRSVPPLPAQPGVQAWQAVLQAGFRPAAAQAGPDDLCVMPYSSGTTGAPKGCMHSHRTVMAPTAQRALWTASCSSTVVLASLPFFHVAGMQGGLNGPVYAGSTIVVMTRWNRQVAAELIQRYRVSNWGSISTMAIDFLCAPGIEGYDLSSLTCIGGGGAAMPEAVEEKLRRLIGLPYVEAYGLSETIGATHYNPPQRPKPQCLGIPIFDVDSRIVDPQSLVELGPGQVGEILIHGPQVFLGYWQRPAETAEAFVELDGKRFLRTGDLGYFDEEGYFFMVDRVKRMINASGFKVWPAEVESLMYRHPAVRECCVIATQDARRGESVKACVVLRDGLSERPDAAALIDWARQQMAAYKAPCVIEFLEALPRSSTGKVLWRELQAREQQAAAV